MQLLNKIVTGWNLSKIIRVALGLLILISSILESNIAGIVAGSLYTFLSLISDGSCCYSPAVSSAKNFKPEDIQYEEVVTKK